MTERVDTPTNFIRQIIDKDIAEGKHTKIITRFPPEPNGYLHVGHAKSICLNFNIARDYQGDCHLRFDDTNPSNESLEYVESIKDNVRWLGGEWDGPVRDASDYWDELYECAVKLIDAGLAYVDNQSPEDIAEYRGNFTTPRHNSPYRDRSVDEHQQLFEDMRACKFEPGKAVLRAKIDMASPNMNLRDPILYRVLNVPHHQTGDKWCIYPMYDFTHPISDAIEGITHSLCTLEFERSEEHTSELQSRFDLVCRLLLENIPNLFLSLSSLQRQPPPLPYTTLFRSMASPNMNLRDPILYRVLNVPHHQTGDKWCIYPMYDFTHPISDAIEGITHSLCTLEFEAHRPL